MTRLDRVLKLLDDYDKLADLVIDEEEMYWSDNPSMLKELRKEKEQLTQELIEHGCRRKNQ